MPKRRKLSHDVGGDDGAPEPLPHDEPQEPKQQTPTAIPWSTFAIDARDHEIRTRYQSDISGLSQTARELAERYRILLLLQPEDSISAFSLDQIYNALTASAEKERDVLLILLSRGGGIEPAYQISKLCKAYARQTFVVAVPRKAKSAGTLIALGADEIHMGPLGQLGPIDPQLGGLPALGVTKALHTIASLSEKHPGSAEMFARYLRMALTVEQIGYCDRVSESAVQYAERLLSNKSALIARAAQIAYELVYEYKDHGFVIDFDEAKQHLGQNWIKTGTAELEFAEAVYRHFDWVNLFLDIHKSKRLMAIGSDSKPTVVLFDNT